VQRLIFNKNFIEGVIQKVMSPMADLMVWQVDPFEILSSNGMAWHHFRLPFVLHDVKVIKKCIAPCRIKLIGLPC